MKPKHSKYKNTGILFELLTRQITSETISNVTPRAVGILKKFFGNNSTLLKEYQIYHALLNKKFEKEANATVLLETLINAHSKLNKSALRRERYNLVREIKDTYNIEDFFKAKISNYKVYASVYNLLEHQKYSGLNNNQRILLKEYVYNISNSPKLKHFINEEIIKVKSEIRKLSKSTDKVTQIKLNEITGLIKPLCKKSSVHDDNVINLLNYYELVNELKSL
jgi:hypothetical protein